MPEKVILLTLYPSISTLPEVSEQINTYTVNEISLCHDNYNLIIYQIPNTRLEQSLCHHIEIFKDLSSSLTFNWLHNNSGEKCQILFYSEILDLSGYAEYEQFIFTFWKFIFTFYIGSLYLHFTFTFLLLFYSFSQILFYYSHSSFLLCA